VIRNKLVGSWKLEAGSGKLEGGSWKWEVGSWKLEGGGWKKNKYFQRSFGSIQKSVSFLFCRDKPEGRRPKGLSL
jgi:hypothetical protein